MAVKTARARMQNPADLRLPPPFTPVRLRELGHAFEHAVTIAAEQGAGTLVHVGGFDLAEFALVLEPEEPLALARRAFYAGMTALTDALIAHAQPETSVTVEWPDAIKVNGGLVGGGRLAWPASEKEHDVPAWLVFGGMIRTVSMLEEPGLNPLVTALEEEGFTDVMSGQIMESFARNFMVALDAWHERGFAAVAKTYLERLPREQGLNRGIEDNGDLLLRRVGKAGAERLQLLPRLAQPSWYDAAARGPRS